MRNKPAPTNRFKQLLQRQKCHCNKPCIDFIHLSQPPKQMTKFKTMQQTLFYLQSASSNNLTIMRYPNLQVKTTSKTFVTSTHNSFSLHFNLLPHPLSVDKSGKSSQIPCQGLLWWQLCFSHSLTMARSEQVSPPLLFPKPTTKTTTAPTPPPPPPPTVNVTHIQCHHHPLHRDR